MISIIIPIYNTDIWLEECLKSVKDQSFSDFEVLMIDDGSVDRSAGICSRFAEQDSRFRYYHQTNSGVSVARNTGLKHANGEWICFVDADDVIDKDYLNELNRCANDDFDAVNCGYTLNIKTLGSNGSFSTVDRNRFIREIVYERIKYPQLWSLLYRHDIILRNNLCFTPGCTRNEDYEFYMKYLTCCEKPIARTTYVGYYYRPNPSSVMHQKRSLQAVTMSVDATTNVAEAVVGIGIIADKSILISFSITTFLYTLSRERNLEIYNELHSIYPVGKCTSTALLHGGIRVRGAALLYKFLGRNLFYKFFSHF